MSNPCEPKATPVNGTHLEQSVIITWSTDGVANHPGETFDGGSGYWLGVRLIATARHIGEIVRDGLKREGEREKGGVQPYAMQVHHPSSGLSWQVVDEIPVEKTDISILKVEPVPDDKNSTEQHEKFDASTPISLHRSQPVSDGERLTIRGFVEISSTMDADNRLVGGNMLIRVEAEGRIGAGDTANVSEPRRLEIRGINAIGNMSGGPVTDEQGRIVGVVSISPEGDGCYTVVAPWLDCLPDLTTLDGAETVGSITAGGCTFRMRIQ